MKVHESCTKLYETARNCTKLRAVSCSSCSFMQSEHYTGTVVAVGEGSAPVVAATRMEPFWSLPASRNSFSAFLRFSAHHAAQAKPPQLAAVELQGRLKNAGLADLAAFAASYASTHAPFRRSAAERASGPITEMSVGVSTPPSAASVLARTMKGSASAAPSRPGWRRCSRRRRGRPT